MSLTLWLKSKKKNNKNTQLPEQTSVAGPAVTLLKTRWQVPWAWQCQYNVSYVGTGPQDDNTTRLRTHNCTARLQSFSFKKRIYFITIYKYDFSF